MLDILSLVESSLTELACDVLDDISIKDRLSYWQHCLEQYDSKLTVLEMSFHC